MAELWIAYRDVEGFPRKQFERLPTPKAGEMRVKDHVLPAFAGYKAMYVKWHRITLKDTIVNLITYTEEAISIRRAAELAEEALKQP